MQISQIANKVTVGAKTKLLAISAKMATNVNPAEFGDSVLPP